MDKLLYFKKNISNNVDSVDKDEFLYVICDLDIEVFYNRQCLHSYLSYLSPENFEKKNVA
jgi:hypothetical protein